MLKFDCSLYDGLSFSYILEDVAAAYHDVEVPKRPQFTDAVPFILHSSKDESNFWETRLSGYTACPLPRNPTPDNGIHLAHVDFCLPSGSLDEIKAMGVTVQAVALLAWYVYSLSSQSSRLITAMKGQNLGYSCPFTGCRIWPSRRW